MVELTINLPQRGYRWIGGHQNERLHNFVLFPSGVSNHDFLGEEPQFVKEGSQQFLKIRFLYNPIMLDVDRIFDHPIFRMNNDGEHGYYSGGLHPKVIAFKEHINRLTGDLDTKKMKLVVKIPLPSEGEFILTPSRVSGHLPVFPISCNEVDAPGNESDSEVFILMFDLMEKKKKTTTHTSRRKKSPVNTTSMLG